MNPTSLLAALLVGTALGQAPGGQPLPQDLGSAYQAARRTLASAPKAASNVETLLKRTRDRDAGVRREAVRALKAYSHVDSRVRDRLLEIVKDSGEDFSVRYQAVKSLSPAAPDSEVRGLLLDVAKGSKARPLRPIACKALYWESARDSEVRKVLLGLARRGTGGVRLAALWGLFASGGDPDVREELVEIAEDDRDAPARVEALKSLYSSMWDADVRKTARELAGDSSTEKAVRYTAILMLSDRSDSSDTELLKRIAEDDDDPQARQAALVALGGPASETIKRHFHLIRRSRRYPYPVIHDPLDDE